MSGDDNYNAGGDSKMSSFALTYELLTSAEIPSVDKPNLLAKSQSCSVNSQSPHNRTSISSDENRQTGLVSNPKCVVDSVTWVVHLSITELQFFECNNTTKEWMSISRVAGGPIAFKYQLSNLLYYKLIGSDLQLQFVTPESGHKYRLAKTIRISGFASDQHLYQWVQQLDYIGMVRRRPKHLEFIVNPVSGKKDSRKYFSKTVEPLLKSMGISYVKHETERKGHATEICQNLNLASIDGIIVLGGDGTANEVTYGLTDFSAKSDRNSHGLKTTTRIGIIPCGTSNNLSYAVHGGADRLTALLFALLGHSVNVDLMTARKPDSDSLLGIAMTMIAYGFIADSIKESEKLRKLPGTLGYSISFLRSIQKMRKYPGTVHLSMAGPDDITPHNSPPCKANCQHCRSSPEQDPESSTQITLQESKIFGLQIHNHPGICELAPRGATLNAHLGDGCMDVLLTRDLKQKEAIAMLKEVGKKDGQNLPFDFVEARRVNRVIFKADESNQSCWILDGEVIETPDIVINIHKQAVPFFGRGVEPELSTLKIGCMKSFCSCS